MVKEAILFDHDGVLVDTEPLYFRANAHAYSQAGLQLDEGRYLEDMDYHEGSWRQARAAGASDALIACMRAARDAHYQQLLQAQSVEIPGVVEALAALAPRFRMGIVTSCKRPDFELIHRDGRIRSFMEFAVLREDSPAPKPSPDPYLQGLAKLGCPAASCLVVEDSAKGLRAAIAAGMDCIIVHNAFTATQDFTGAKYHIDSLAELPALLSADSAT